jgi:hypothetical protein
VSATSTRTIRSGLAIGLVYGAIAALTSLVSGRPTLPLFEGIGAPPPYRWVEPPSDFASGNVKPTSVSRSVQMGPSGNVNGDSIATGDAQAVVTLAPGSIPPHAGAASATVHIDPVGPSTLPPLPDGHFPDGNGYRVSVTYPDGSTLAKFAKSAEVLIRAPTTADAGVYALPPGGAWQTVPTITNPQPNHYPMQTTIIGTFLAATQDQVFGLASSGGGGSGSIVIALVAGAIAAAVVAVVLIVLARRRSRGRDGQGPVASPRARDGKPRR